MGAPAVAQTAEQYLVCELDKLRAKSPVSLCAPDGSLFWLCHPQLAPVTEVGGPGSLLPVSAHPGVANYNNCLHSDCWSSVALLDQTGS